MVREKFPPTEAFLPDRLTLQAVRGAVDECRARAEQFSWLVADLKLARRTGGV
jgi:hypothetical protein